MHVAVIGAGAFGGWTALSLRRKGAQVTLVDAWGPGNSKSSSGGETRIIRSIYGSDLVSMRLSRRSLQLWKENEVRWNTHMFERTGALFLGGSNDEFLTTSSKLMRQEGIQVEELTAREARVRFPQINFDGIELALFEPDAGCLLARENCRTVVRQFVAEGGRFEVAQVVAPSPGRNLRAVALSNGEELRADQFVFACGPWLGGLFPDVVGDLIRPSRQEVMFLAVPPGDPRFSAPHLPCWADRTSTGKFYGIPDVQHRGFKIASDLRGRLFRPDEEDRVVEPQLVENVRSYVGQRFPALSNAALAEARVCQYENTPDLALLVDRHPQARNVYLAGGGSGHGYKQAPALGEYIAGLMFGELDLEPQFELARFSGRQATDCDYQGATI